MADAGVAAALVAGAGVAAKYVADSLPLALALAAICVTCLS